MFTVALSIIAEKWKESKCPSADEEIKKLWCKIIQPQKGVKYSYSTTWMTLKNIVLRM